jgi:hypothetical protein
MAAEAVSTAEVAADFMALEDLVAGASVVAAERPAAAIAAAVSAVAPGHMKAVRIEVDPHRVVTAGPQIETLNSVAERVQVRTGEVSAAQAAPWARTTRSRTGDGTPLEALALERMLRLARDLEIQPLAMAAGIRSEPRTMPLPLERAPCLRAVLHLVMALRAPAGSRQPIR